MNYKSIAFKQVYLLIKYYHEDSLAICHRSQEGVQATVSYITKDELKYCARMFVFILVKCAKLLTNVCKSGHREIKKTSLTIELDSLQTVQQKFSILLSKSILNETVTSRYTLVFVLRISKNVDNPLRRRKQMRMIS